MLPEYLNIEKRYYYTKLNDSEKRLYEFMVDCLMNNQMKFIYKYEFDDIDLNSNVLPVFTASLFESIIMTKVWTYMLLDFPEFYFVHEFVLLHLYNFSQLFFAIMTSNPILGHIWRNTPCYKFIFISHSVTFTILFTYCYMNSN